TRGRPPYLPPPRRPRRGALVRWTRQRLRPPRLWRGPPAVPPLARFRPPGIRSRGLWKVALSRSRPLAAGRSPSGVCPPLEGCSCHGVPGEETSRKSRGRATLGRPPAEGHYGQLRLPTVGLRLESPTVGTPSMRNHPRVTCCGAGHDPKTKCSWTV